VDANGKHRPGGTEPGQHLLEVDVSLDELADILGEELQLPRIKPRASTASPPRRTATAACDSPDRNHYGTSSAPSVALRRRSSMHLRPRAPRIIFERRDKMYRSWRSVLQPQSNAVIVYMMDVSGSHGR